MIRIMLASLAAAALLSMAVGGDAFSQTAKKGKSILLPQYAIDGDALGSKAKKQPGSLSAGQRRQRLYPAAGCPQCRIKKD